MMKALNLQIEFRSIEHLEDKSCYNHNYYKVTPNQPWWSLFGNDIIEEVCHEDENYFTFALGHFDKHGKFVSVASWESDYGCIGIEEYICEV